ncbi:MAG: hypothetical protein V1835_04985 [Candidatus Micrarchaeota archaeon]
MPKLDTSIDRLVEFVTLKKSCTVDDASKSLGMPSKQVEELAEILAESGLIDVRYEFSGIRLTPKIVRKEGDDAKGKAERKLTLAERMDGIGKELQDAENMFVFSEKDILRKVENAKVHFKEIEKYEISEQSIPVLKKKAFELDSSIRVFEEKIDSLEKATLDVRKEVDMFAGQVEKIQVGRGGFRLPRFGLGRILTKIKTVFRRKKKDVAEKQEQITIE